MFTEIDRLESDLTSMGQTILVKVADHDHGGPQQARRGSSSQPDRASTSHIDHGANAYFSV